MGQNVVVVGGGATGLRLQSTLAGQGRKVTVIEILGT